VCFEEYEVSTLFDLEGESMLEMHTIQIEKIIVQYESALGDESKRARIEAGKRAQKHHSLELKNVTCRTT
jgi:hypothetical protein